MNTPEQNQQTLNFLRFLFTGDGVLSLRNAACRKMTDREMDIALAAFACGCTVKGSTYAFAVGDILENAIINIEQPGHTFVKLMNAYVDGLEDK